MALVVARAVPLRLTCASGPPSRRHLDSRASSRESTWIRFHASAISSTRRRARVVVPFAKDKASDETAETPSVLDDFTDPLATQFKAMYATPGKRIKWGVFTEDLDENEGGAKFSDEQSASLRAAAALALTNIDLDERTRRGLVGRVFVGVTVALVAAQLVTHQPAEVRSLVALPLFFALGFLGSEKEGL